MKLHHTEYKKNYKKYILDCLSTEDALIDRDYSDDEKIAYLFNRFYSEYDWAIERYGKLKALSEWLQGLAINIEYYDDAIVQLAEEMGSIDENPTEKMRGIVLNNYWDFMANVILSFEPSKEVA